MFYFPIFFFHSLYKYIHIRIHTHTDTYAHYYIKGITSPGSSFESSIVSTLGFYLSIFIAIWQSNILRAKRS